MEHRTDGILLIDKIEGETSIGVVKKVRRLMKVGKVGHAGTLDPFASGLLIILLGRGTKLSRFIMSENKIYLATIRLGVETDTLDHTGRVVSISDVPEINQEYIQERAQGFVGEDIEQVPPSYSAVKYRGKRAYKLARSGFQIDLHKRKVTVHSIRILSVKLPDVAMEVRCSGGTYIRSLAADLGRSLGTGGHLRSLRRLASGSFEVQHALSSREISTKLDRSIFGEKVIPLRAALPSMHEIEVEELLAEKVRHGYQPTREELTISPNVTGIENGHIKLVRRGHLVAIAKILKSEGGGHNEVRIERVFS